MAFHRVREAVSLGREFHHNGLSLVSAQIGRTPRGPRRGGTVHGCPRRRSSCCAQRVGRSADTLITDVLPLHEAPELLVALRRGVGASSPAIFTVEP